MKFLRFWAPVILWMAVIFFFSSRQSISVSTQKAFNFLFFKPLHVLEYAVLYLLSFRAMKNSYSKRPLTQWVFWSFLIAIVYAVSDEIHQLFVSTREGTVRDVIIDTLGAALVWIFIAKLLPRMPKKPRAWVRHWLAI